MLYVEGYMLYVTGYILYGIWYMFLYLWAAACHSEGLAAEAFKV